MRTREGGGEVKFPQQLQQLTKLLNYSEQRTAHNSIRIVVARHCLRMADCCCFVNFFISTLFS